MLYDSPAAFRMALERRLANESQATGVALDRLRRRVVFGRIITRLHYAEPGLWVLKGGMALEVRLGHLARTSKDLDLGLRQDVVQGEELRDRLIDALAADPDGDWFTFVVGPTQQLQPDPGGRFSWRYSVSASLAGKVFGAMRIDVAPRSEELEPTQQVTIRADLGFAGIEPRAVEVIDVNRHAAEKLHALTRTYGDRPNSRVRDLVDLVLLIEQDQLDVDQTRVAVESVFAQRATHALPSFIAAPPSSWHSGYGDLVGEVEVGAQTLPDALTLVRGWWAQMFPDEEA